MEEFLASVERSAFRMARIATGDNEEALDIVQDAMLGLVRSYSHKPSSEWRPLFYMILQNRIRDWARRRSSRGRWLGWLRGAADDEGGRDRDPLESVADPEARGPVDMADTSFALSAIDTALGGLPLRQQQVFLLRAWEGLSVKEAARAMGCTEGTVKTLYSRAVHRLRSELEDYRP